MPESRCTQKEFLTESKLKGFFFFFGGGGLLLLDLEIFVWEVK